MSARTVPLIIALILVGCSDEPAEQAAEIAAEIRAEPDRAEEILEEHDMTIEEFETLMYQVASDPELSERYSEALPPEAGDEELEEGDEEDEEDEEGEEDEEDDE